jgi:hypothetical protein
MKWQKQELAVAVGGIGIRRCGYKRIRMGQELETCLRDQRNDHRLSTARRNLRIMGSSPVPPCKLFLRNPFTLCRTEQGHKYLVFVDGIGPLGRIAQLVEHLTHNQAVPGSSPGEPTIETTLAAS